MTTTTTTTTSTPHLMRYETGEYIRIATEAERMASVEAATRDGGAGVITVEIDGAEVDCYVLD